MNLKARIRLIALVSSLFAVLAFATGTATAATTPGPAWKLTLASNPTNFIPGSSADTNLFFGIPQYTLVATNVGGAPSSGEITITDTLPAGLTAISIEGSSHGAATPQCQIVAPTVTCTISGSGPVRPGKWVSVGIRVAVGDLPDPTVLSNQATISGGSAAPRTTTTTTTVTDALSGFGLISGEAGLSASLTEADGSAATQAASHPYGLTVDLGPSTVDDGFNLLAADGGLRDSLTVLPAGMVVNPAATPVLCTEAQLESLLSCPPASQLGTVTINTVAPTILPTASPLYNMVPPPGEAASFGFDAVGAGIYAHIFGGVREGDYVLKAEVSDILARGLNPILSVQVQLWGDPSGESHDANRGLCGLPAGGDPSTCSVERQDTPLLSAPTRCAEAISLEAEIASWGHPDHFVSRSAPLTDSTGAPTPVTDCDKVKFEPSLKARPTTDAADSPTGLDVSLKIPQTNSFSELATAHLRKAVVTLPEGLVLNPASANGLQGCTSDQIGLKTAVGATPVRFDEAPAACPDAAKIGTVSVKSPLLEPPLPGSVFVATPEDNPFGSLLAIYIVLDDPKSGVIVKLAGHVIPDPQTGRLTTVFDEGPQLPFDEFKLDFFAGPGAALRTPPICGPYATTSQMTPWSAPDSGPPATPSDTYEITKSPNGGECPTTPAAQPHAPAFDGGAVSPIAGAHSPFVINLRRSDGSQNFAALTVTPPPGLLAKLAGTTNCPDSALAAAAAKSGREELASPSCPDSSRVGSVTVAAGAGPAPYHTTGTAYLTGPYKSAPLSLAIITPAAAGPYDLGTVVTRTALHVNPATAQVSAVSDPIPSILQGIPLDVRSVSVALDRPDFSLNPTSCNEMAITGSVLSTIGALAPLHSRFQLGECARLGFKPKLSLKLKGATKRATNPRLIATLTARPGDANIASAQVKLPKAAFLDNAHIKTICTRVQFAADTCPPGSVYGKASATTPLLDEPLSGLVYLRSSSNPLPDLVVDLRGPTARPVRVELAGRTDSVKGALRNTFDLVPDAPVSSFRLELFGGKRGLVELSRNLCRGKHRASVRLDAHNGDAYDTDPLVGSSCKKKKRGKKHHRRGGS